MCLQLIYYLTHIKGINWQDSCNSLFKKGSNDCYGSIIELNIILLKLSLILCLLFLLEDIAIPINILINVYLRNKETQQTLWVIVSIQYDASF